MNFRESLAPQQPNTIPAPEPVEVTEMVEQKESLEPKTNPELIAAAFAFLGDQHEIVDPSFIESAALRAQSKREQVNAKLRMEDEHSKTVAYNKYKKQFEVGGIQTSIGTIVASRHWGTSVALPDDLDQYGDGKRLRKTYAMKSAEDALCNELNYALADKLAVQFEMKDTMKAEGFRGMRNRARQEGVSKRMEGAFAEKIMIGVIEAISIDRPDLGISVMPANAYQDMEEKIDFVIHMKNKKRGAGVEEIDPVETTLGIQFTMNTDQEKTRLKHDQIAKAKKRGLDVDDLIYVAIDQNMMERARQDWKNEKKGNNSIAGPWAFLPEKVRKETIKRFFKNLLTEQQIEGLKI